MCGACCTGSPGYVAFTEEEARGMASRLGLSVDAFYARFARRLRGVGWSLRERRTEHGYDCVFLDRESQPGKALCAIHDARPAQCRTWPFWPENLRTRAAWERTARACEGVGRGAVVTIERIRAARDATPSPPA